VSLLLPGIIGVCKAVGLGQLMAHQPILKAVQQGDVGLM